MGVRVGKPIVVGEVLSKSANLIMKTPALLIPQVIVLVLSLLEDLANVATLSVLELILVFISLIVSIIVAGAYPSLVQESLSGRELDIPNSLRQAFGRFFTLLIAGILVGLIVLLGTIALIVPGIIFVTWYAYTVPAIMLENKGALAGMSASKAFGRDKKWSTFAIFVVIIVVAIVVGIIDAAVSFASPLGGKVVESLLSVPLEAWVSVIITYAYITYGPSATPTPPDASAYGIPPGPMQPPYSQPDAALGPAAVGGFCRHCGSPVQPGSKYCNNCGQAL